MSQKVLFLDLDGTLLNDKKTISGNDSSILYNYVKDGNDVIITSGRSHMSLQVIEQELYLQKQDGYTIAFNGGVVYNRKTKEKLQEMLMDYEKSVDILKFLKKFTSNIICYADDKIYIENFTKEIMYYITNTKIAPFRVSSFLRKIKQPFHKIVVLGEEAELLIIKEKFYEQNIANDIDCFFSSHNLLEFNPSNYSKGTAVSFIMNLPEFKGKTSIVVGDSYNDIPMFKAADISIAVANSDQEVKDNADYVTQSTNNDGILNEIIEKYTK